MRWLAFVALLLATGCTTSTPEASMAFDSRPALVFVHGYYGSALRDKQSGRRMFLSAREVLFGRRPFSLFSDALGTPPGPELEVEGVFDNVPIIPLFYSVDVYGKFLDFSRALPGVQVVPIVYDWRQDLQGAVDQLDRTVRALRHAGSKKIVIVGHSMGGIVTAYYLGYGGQKFDSAKLNWTGANEVNQVYFLGTPFGGSFNIFRNLQRGANFAWNPHLLPEEAVASFPSSYALLPRRGRFFLLPDKKPQERSLVDYHFWRDYRLGLLAKRELPEALRSAREKFTREQLARAARLAERLKYSGCEPRVLPQVINVVNGGVPTVDAGYLDPGKKELFFDTDGLQQHGLDPAALVAPGDGTVTVTAAELPRALAARSRRIESRLAHDRLFEDPELRKELKRYFSE